MSARNMCSTARSTSVTRSIVPFLSTRTPVPNRAICISPARTTASTAVARNRGSGGGGTGALDLLHHVDLHPALRTALQDDFVHEVADEENAAAAALEDVLGRQRIRDLLGIEPFALVAHANDEL